MSRKLRIAANLALPLEAVTQSLAILAKRRAGKSYTARRFAEELLAAEQQVVIIDPKGDWWGIRSGADGKSPGFPVVVLGGEHGDLPLEKTAADTIARLIVEERVSVLLDLSDFKKWEIPFFLGGDAKQHREGLLELIYRLKAKEEYRTPMMLVVDEADAIAPQKPYPGEERMLGAMEDIVRRGGQRGIGALLISQRSAVVNKNVLTQTQVMIAMRTIAEQDLSAIMGWVDVHGVPEQAKILKDSLPALPVGDAWILSPGWPDASGIFERIHVLPISTFDSGATPKAGEKRIKPKNLADVDMAALQRRMAETIERAKASDPKELTRQLAAAQKKIAELEKGATPKMVYTSEAAQKHYQRGYEAAALEQRGAHDKYRKELSALARAHGTLQKELHLIEEHAAFAAQVHNNLIELGKSMATRWDAHASALPSAEAPAAEIRQPQAAFRPRDRVVRETRTTEHRNGIQPAEQRILDAIGEFEALQIPNPARVQVAFMAGYTNLNSKGFTNAIGALRTAGQIAYPSAGSICLTEEGRQAAAIPDAPISSEQLQRRLMDMLGGANARILKIVIDAYPESVDRAELGTRSGYGNLNSKGFTNAIGRLRSLGLIDYPERGRVQAQPVLFLR